MSLLKFLFIPEIINLRIKSKKVCIKVRMKDFRDSFYLYFKDMLKLKKFKIKL